MTQRLKRPTLNEETTRSLATYSMLFGDPYLGCDPVVKNCCPRSLKQAGIPDIRTGTLHICQKTFIKQAVNASSVNRLNTIESYLEGRVIHRWNFTGLSMSRRLPLSCYVVLNNTECGTYYCGDSSRRAAPHTAAAAAAAAPDPTVEWRYACCSRVSH